MKESPEDTTEQEILDAQNGVTADLIRGLDLSTEEGIESLRKILDKQRKVRILDENGDTLFPFKESSADYEIELVIKDTLDRFSKLSFFYNSDVPYAFDERAFIGHQLIKVGDDWLSFLSSKEFILTLKSEHSNSEEFFAITGIIANYTACSLNDSLPSGFLTFMNIAVKKGEVSEDFMKNHPNYLKIIELRLKVYKLFNTLKEVFTKYLSNIINNPNYSFQTENSLVSIEQLESDDNLALKMVEFIREKSTTDFLKSAVKKQELETAIDTQVDLLSNRIDEYQKLLDLYNSELVYAKPKV